MRFHTLFAALVIFTTSSHAESGRIINIETKEASRFTTLTNGATFVVGNTTYKLELNLSEDEQLEQQLKNSPVSLRLKHTQANEAIQLLTQLSGESIVFSQGVAKDTHIDLNIRKKSFWAAIEQVCTQIGAKAEVRNGAVLILPIPDKTN